MPSPAEPHPDFSGQTPLTASALDQLDAQVASAEKECVNLSSHKHAVLNPDIQEQIQPTSNPSSKMRESTKRNADLDAEISKDSSASHNSLSSTGPHQPHHASDALPLLMTDYIVDGTIYRHPETLNNLITIAPTPDKGLAVFALRDLPPHTLILSERPLVALNDNGARADPLDALVNALPPALKRAYRSLHGFSAATPAAPKARESLNRRVLYSNGFAIERTTTAVFEVASRINHSCVPNARFRWDEEAGRMDYYVIRKVLEGEEVCIDYGHTKGRLLKYYGFDCACGGCTEWGSVSSSSGAPESTAEARLVQADGLWRSVEVDKISAAVKVDKTNTATGTPTGCGGGGGGGGGGELDEQEKENL